MDGLYVFENSSIELYSRQSFENTTKSLKIISDTDNEKIGNEFCTIPFRVKNPFLMMALWISCEILDLESIINAINQIDKILRERAKLVQKIDADNAEIQSLSEGRATLKSMFKSRQGRNDLISNLKTTVNRNRVIMETYRNVINGLIIFMEMKEIPNFKIMKTSQYYKSLTTFLNCCHQDVIKLWDRLINILNNKEEQWDTIIKQSPTFAPPIQEQDTIEAENRLQVLNLDDTEEVVENVHKQHEQTKRLEDYEAESRLNGYKLFDPIDHKRNYSEYIMNDYMDAYEKGREACKSNETKELVPAYQNRESIGAEIEKVKDRHNKEVEFEYA